MNKFFDYSNSTDYPIFFDECLIHAQNKLFVNTINNNHRYMDYKDIPSRRLNWNIYETTTGNLIGAMGLSSGVLALNSREKFIGWGKEAKQQNLNMIGNNYRFCLIKDNITIRNVGTMALKLMREVGAKRWKEKYGDDLMLIETFVKPPWTGSVYKADNWVIIGMTKGNSIKKAPLHLWKKENSKRGELARTDPEAAVKKYASYQTGQHYYVEKSEPKIIMVKPLIKKWKKVLCSYDESI